MEIQQRLAEFEGIYDIRNTYSEGKHEIKIKLKDNAHTLGLNASDLARQVRADVFRWHIDPLERAVRAVLDDRLLEPE